MFNYHALPVNPFKMDVQDHLNGLNIYIFMVTVVDWTCYCIKEWSPEIMFPVKFKDFKLEKEIFMFLG